MHYSLRNAVLLNSIPVVLWFIFLLFNSCTTERAPEPPPPNFILLFTDELQFSDLGSYGGDIPTPQLDSLAAEGLRFTGAYTPASMCTPSRFAVLTGQFPGRCASNSFLQSNPVTEPYSIAWNTWLVENQETLPRILQRNGYFTGMAGKWHIGSAPDDIELPALDADADPADPAVQEKLAARQRVYEELVKQYGGFDYAASVIWGNFDGHPVEALRFHNFPWITHGAMGFLEEAARRDQPFFLYLTPTAIHGPNHVEDLEKDVTLTLEGNMPEVTAYQLDRDRLKEAMTLLPKGAQHRYAGMAQIDYQLGLVRDKLAELGLADNTVILFMSDHNIEPGKATSFEKGIHIPMIAYWPGKTAGEVTEALVQNTDVLPTVLEAAGIEIQDSVVRDGVSFLPVIGNPETSVRSHVFAENGYTRAVNDGRWKYIALRYPERHISAMNSGEMDHVPSYVGNWPQAHSAIAMQAFPGYFDQDQLYDLQRDPYELNNLAGEPAYAEKIDSLKDILREHLQTFIHPFSLEPIPFLSSKRYEELQEVNRSYDLSNIPWLRRDHGGISWPPETFTKPPPRFRKRQAE